MATTASQARARHVTPADVRGLTALGFDAALGVADLVEQMHLTIARGTHPVGTAPTGRTRGITGLVYRTVRGTMQGIGRGLDGALSLLASDTADRAGTPERDAVQAIVNGLWGDHLAARANPLAIPMRLRVAGRVLGLSPDAVLRQLGPVGPRVLVLVHGLCMNDRQWLRDGHDHGAMLAREAGYTPLYLHYNSGRHVSENGRELSALLKDLLANWPVPVQDLVLLGHSMGGLVARSACHVAALDRQPWLQHLGALVCLGTPHHGAVLERGGHLVDMALGVSPYVAPFARIGKARSAGITDLRFGNLQDADWKGRERCAQRRDDRHPTPLPEGVPVYVVAATRSSTSGGAGSRWVGDGLVPLASALGDHRSPLHSLGVPQGRRLVVTEANHFDLLAHPAVAAQLRGWLGSVPGVEGDARPKASVPSTSSA